MRRPINRTGQRRFPAVPISCALLIIVTLAVYSKVRNNSFVSLDDSIYITQNQQVQGGISWNTFVWALTSTHLSGNWHPLTWLSHALDCQIYGLNPVGHHITNVLLHSLNAVILFLLLARATGATGRSLLVAALFALHPINVESVAWAAERKNVLSTMFFLLTLGAYGWYALRPNFKRYGLVTLLFVLALASKPMAITLPFVFLLLDFWPLQRVTGWNSSQDAVKRRNVRKGPTQSQIINAGISLNQLSFGKLVREKLPWLLFCFGSAVVTLIAQKSSGALEATARIPFDIRLGNAVNSYAGYLVKIFWPVRLAVYYPYPSKGVDPWRVGLAAFLLIVTTALVCRQSHRRRYLASGWFWYLGTAVPVIGVIQVGNQAMADRYGYVPLIGIFVMVAWGLSEVFDRSGIGGNLRTCAAVLVLGALSFFTWQQVGYWRSDYDLWNHAVNVTEENPLAQGNLAGALRRLGRQDEALSHYQAAVRLSPFDPIRHQNLAVDLAELGRLQDAVTEYTTAVTLTSSRAIQVRTYESLATIYGSLGDYSKVAESYQHALQVDPQQGFGMLSRLSGYVEMNPTGEGYLSLGLLQEQIGNIPEARAAYQHALRLNPTLDAARESLDALGEAGNK